MGPPLVRTRLAVLAFQDVLREDESRVLSNNLEPGEVDLLIDGDIASIAVGYGHALVATTDGAVFAWGRNDSFGKLGIGANEPVIVPRKPQRVLGELKEKRIVMVAAGSHHSLALSDEGTVYGWGMDEYGQTGVSSVRARNEPRAITRVPPHVKMVKIDAGWNHSAMIDENGVLYTTGVGRDGQLGVGVGENRSVPNAVTSITEKVIDVSCGYSHTALVTESHKVYSFGVDGLRAIYISYFPIPRQVQPLSGMGIVQVASGNNFTLFLSDTGVVFAGGLNDVGQLGLGDKESRTQPVLVSALLDHFVVKVGHRKHPASECTGNLTRFYYSPISERFPHLRDTQLRSPEKALPCIGEKESFLRGFGSPALAPHLMEKLATESSLPRPGWWKSCKTMWREAVETFSGPLGTLEGI
mmetsp:Transcript_5530/g.23461  ORF Transcript_5530/g.23461 Transcript_5530/m.23461 type:complete len:413 (+) Transcript_5530:214-1452(+)